MLEKSRRVDTNQSSEFELESETGPETQWSECEIVKSSEDRVVRPDGIHIVSNARLQSLRIIQ